MIEKVRKMLSNLLVEVRPCTRVQFRNTVDRDIWHGPKRGVYRRCVMVKSKRARMVMMVILLEPKWLWSVFHGGFLRSEYSDNMNHDHET